MNKVTATILTLLLSTTGISSYAQSTLRDTDLVKKFSIEVAANPRYDKALNRSDCVAVNGYILKGQLGLLAFSDGGRVWIPDEESNVWHWGYGGGIFFIPYNKIAFTVSYGVSNEAQLLTLKAGFLF